MAEENVSIVELEWDPYRTIFGLGRIGYTPPAAIGDIIDNSVRAGAKNIFIHIIKRNPESLDLKKNNVKEYIIIDDGMGMDEKGILDALKLGSPDENYEENSLSKFGLGLKAAAFSQGNVLEVISSLGNTEFVKYVVSLEDIKNVGKYFAKKVDTNDIDKQIISEYLPDGKGTLVRIGDIRMMNHPSVKDTLKELEYRLGVIYYYFINDEGIKITIKNAEETTEIEPYDVLFTDEADKNGNLDENEWDGQQVKWIKRINEPIDMDTDHDVKATIEVTQLPHPPTFKPNDLEIRKNYKIEAGNYGYYVYRNKRLISWAERFGNIIPLDQDFYSFRGRIIIDDSADDAFNIDVKKSSIVLSDDAANVLNDLSADYKRKSKRAWNRAKELIKQREGKEPNVTANRIVSDIDEPDFPVEKTEEEERREKEKQQELAKKMKENIKKQAVEEKREREGKDIKEDEVTEEEIEETLKGTANPEVSKIFRVSSIFDNLLWEPYYDAENGRCVRINKNHRFSKLLFEDNNSNTDLQIIIEVLLLNLAQAEFHARTSKEFDGIDIEKHLTDFRHIVSDYLTHLCRKKANELPPNNKEL
jgi:hypothetical protein